jgi:hypothetical protein
VRARLSSLKLHKNRVQEISGIGSAAKRPRQPNDY